MSSEMDNIFKKQQLSRERHERNMLIAFGGPNLGNIQHVHHSEYASIQEMMEHLYHSAQDDYIKSLHRPKETLQQDKLTYNVFVCNDLGCGMCQFLHL